MITPSETQIKATIFELLRNIAPEADLSKLRDDVDVRETLGIDSYDFLNFMIGLSEAYSIEIPEADYGKLVTLSDMVHYITTHSR